MKMLSVSNEKKLADVLGVIYEDPKRKYIFSKEFVGRLSDSAYYGKHDVRTAEGYVDIYEFINEKGDTMNMTFCSELVELKQTNLNDEVFKGYILKEITTVIGKVIKTKPESKDVVIIK